MTLPSIPPNAYTCAPQQHPNLILGSLQLLFWLVFRPSAWENHVHHLEPSLDKNFSLLQLSSHRRWRQARLWRLVIQGLILLPILASLITAVVSLGLGTPLDAVAGGIAVGMAFGMTAGLGFGMTGGVVRGVAFSVAVSIAFGMTGGLAEGMAGGLAVGMAFGMTGSLAEGMGFGLVIGFMVGLARSTAVGIAGGMAIGIGAWVNWWRPVLLSVLLAPWHWLLYRIDQNRAGRRTSLLHRHLAFWDEWQYLPLWGLDKHLLLVLERSPAEGQVALDYLSTSRQRWAAQAAQIELDARQLERCADVVAIGQIYHSLTVGELNDPAGTLLRSFNRISEDVDAALNQNSAYNQRLALKAIADRLDGFVRELTRSSDQYAVRFRPIAQRWSRIIELTLEELVQASELQQEIDSPYIIGVPLTERQDIFVGRTEISSRIEQLLLDRRRPPLLLYGQRRTGKTSLLNNLGRLLPNSIIPMFVDLQGPASRASDHAGFLYNLAKGMSESAKSQRSFALPPLTREALAADPFTQFDEWLDEVEIRLENNTALLELDEFEVLDQVLVEGRFSETAVLGMLRNLIQHRPRFKVLLSGSHTLEEFQRWSSYLINAQVVHIGYLKESEARQLIEHPIKDFALRYEPAASQRVLDLTRGHPFLVQLVCAEIVALKNEQDPKLRRLATLTDVETAVPDALSSGSMFFSDIERNQVGPHGLAILRFLAAQGEGATVTSTTLAEQFPDTWTEALDWLTKRELLEPTPEGYRFQVELIRQWFAPRR